MTALTAAPADLLTLDGRPASTAWPLDTSFLHLNHGSYGAVPLVTLEEQRHLRDEMETRPLDWFIGLPERLHAARLTLAPLLRIPAEEFAFVANASAGASAVYGSQPHHEGGEIIVTDHGYGAVVMGAERLARRWHGSVRVVHIPLDADANVTTACVTAAFTDRTRLVVIDQITSPTARHFPVDAVAQAAQERGIAVLVDGAHAPGLLETPRFGGENVYWVGNLHKFACAPRGAAVLSTSPELGATLFPPIDSWGAPREFPERFNFQGTVDMTAVLAAAVSLSFVEEQWGWAAVRTHAAQIAAYAQSLLATAFAERTGDDHLPAVGMPAEAIRLIRLPAGLAETPEAAHQLQHLLLHEYRVETAPTSFDGHGYIRVSGHAYSTAAEIEEAVGRIVDAVSSALTLASDAARA